MDWNAKMLVWVKSYLKKSGSSLKKHSKGSSTNYSPEEEKQKID